MSRALALDGEIPSVTLLDGGSVGEGDVIVAEVSGDATHLTQDHLVSIRKLLEATWPNNKVIVCPPHIRLRVVKQA